jgi:probable phosphoglycerate mutase
VKIYLIRHGQTTGDLEDRYGGDYDDHLSPKGRKQAEALARSLKGKGIETIHHSPRIRATETARIVGNALKVKLKSARGLRERNNYGILTGMKRAEARKMYAGQVKELQRSIRHHVKGSEGYAPFKRRVLAAFRRIAENPSYQSVAVITHGGYISCIARELLHLGEFKSLGDCAIIAIAAEKRKLRLTGLSNAVLAAGPAKSS